MGCTNSKGVVLPVEHTVFPKGSLEVDILNAVLLRDTSVILKMDPYITLKLGTQQFKSLVHKGEGTVPVFNEKFVFHVNNDKIVTGRWMEVAVWDHNMGLDSQIGFGIVDVDPIILNKLNQFNVKCHISHNSKSAGWIKAIVSFRQEFKGKLLVRPISATLRRKVGFGSMNCAVRITVGEDVSTTKAVKDDKQRPVIWNQTIFVSLLKSLPKGKLQIVNVNGSSEQVICEASLNLEALCSAEDKEHEFQLQYKNAHAGSIKISTRFLSPEEFERYSPMEEKKPQQQEMLQSMVQKPKVQE